MRDGESGRLRLDDERRDLFLLFPLTTFGGVCAMTTINSASVELVHHSFSPLRIQPLPSGVGVAVVFIAAGSDPTPAR